MHGKMWSLLKLSTLVVEFAKAVAGLWGPADSANSVHLYYEHLNIAGVLVEGTGIAVLGDPAILVLGFA